MLPTDSNYHIVNIVGENSSDTNSLALLQNGSLNFEWINIELFAN